jgi:hypothetical protein
MARRMVRLPAFARRCGHQGMKAVWGGRQSRPWFRKRPARNVPAVHSAAACSPFPVTERLIKGTRKTSAAPKTPNSQKQSKYDSAKAC